MASDEPRRRDDDDNKPKKWQCCVCRSTKEHRCYKCFCGKCPSYNKKIPPRYGVNDRSYSRPSNSLSKLPRSEDTKVSESVPTDKSSKQSVEIKDLHTGDEHPPGFASHGDGDRHSKVILPNSHPLIVEEQRGNEEVGKKLNEVDGGSSKSNAGPTSIWDILAAKEPRASGKQEGWANHVGLVSSLGLGSVNEQKGHSPGSASGWGDKRVEESRASRKQEEWVNRDGPGSSWGAKRVEEPKNQAGWENVAGKTTSWGVPRGNKDVRDNRSEDKHSKSVSLVPRVESVSRWNSSEKRSISGKESEEINKGNVEPCNQKLQKSEVDGESSKTNTESTSIWDKLAAKATTASGNQAVWAKECDPRGNADRSFSSRNFRKECELRGNVDRSLLSRNSQEEGEPRGNADRSFRSQDSEKERKIRCHADRSVSSHDSRKERESRHNVDRSDSIRGSQKELKPRRNVDRSDSSQDSRKEGNSRGNADISASSRDPRKEREPRGNNEITSNRAISGSRLYSDTRKRSRGGQQRERSEDVSSSPVKKRRGFQEIVDNKPTRDGFSKPVFPNPEVESDPSRVACTVELLRENSEVKSCRAGGGSAEPSTDLVSLREGNQDLLNVKTENEFSATVSSLAAKESTDYPAKHEQYDAATKKIKGIIRANKKFTDPANPSESHAKPPPTVISGEICSSKQKLYDSENTAGVEDLSCSSLDLVGPAKEIIWKGRFEFLKFTENKICESYLAHSAAKVNVEAYKLANQMSGNLQFKMHPVGAFWPKIFKYDQPDARDISLYFYPQNYERSIREYGHLLHLMSDQDLMLRSSMEGVDLLVFSSKLLQRHHQRLKGRNYYMWGVFCQLGKRKVPKVISTAHLEPSQADENSK